MKTLKQLGFRPKPRTPTQHFFEARKQQNAVKPDIDWQPEAEREPQAPHYTQMWLDHWDNWGNVKNPLASPMESGA